MNQNHILVQCPDIKHLTHNMAGAAVQQILYCQAKETRAHAEQTIVRSTKTIFAVTSSLSIFRYEPTVIT